MREGQRYFIKAILIYPFCVKYYIYMLSSFFGIKGYSFLANIKKIFNKRDKEVNRQR